MATVSSSSLSPLSVDTLSAYRHTYLYSPGGSAIMRESEAPERVPSLTALFGDGTFSEGQWRQAILSGVGALPELGDDLMPCGRPSGLHAPRAHHDLPACCEHALAAAGAGAVPAAAAAEPPPQMIPIVAEMFARAAAAGGRLPSPHSVPELAIEPRAAPEEEEIVLSPAAVAVQAAEAVLAEPPPGGEPEPEEWCFSVTVHDLSLRLDMRHPRVILRFLEFVNAYNELAPLNEDIHVPKIPLNIRQMILNHSSVVNPAPEFTNEVTTLRDLVSNLPLAEDDEAEWALDAGAEGAAAPPPAGAEEDWCVSLTCNDLALGLDMRHPLVVLTFLRFVDTYNELVDALEQIHIPLFTFQDREYLWEHAFVADVPPEYQDEMNELWDRVERHKCPCYECRAADGHYSDSYESDGYDSDRPRDY